MRTLHSASILFLALCASALVIFTAFRWNTWNRRISCTSDVQCGLLVGDRKIDNASFVVEVQQQSQNSSNATELSLKFPYEIDGVDKEGSPVVTLPFGTWNVRGAIDEGHGEKVQQRFYEAFEQMEKKVNYLSKLSDGRISSSLVIYDFKGFTFWQVLSFKTIHILGNVLKYYEKNFDIRKLKRWYIINAPGYFSLFFNALRIFSSAQLLSKVEIYGTVKEQWQAVLLERIASDQLSFQYGGTKGGNQTGLTSPI